MRLADADETTRTLTKQLLAEADCLGIDTESIREDAAREAGNEATQNEHLAAAQEAPRQAVSQSRPRCCRGDAGAKGARDSDGLEADGDLGRGLAV